LQCWYDKVLIVDRIVSELPREGAICLRMWALSVRFRNIKVNDPDGNVLWEGLPALPKDK
jgi:hypothetical protein